jgi:hypothetical protein
MGRRLSTEYPFTCVTCEVEIVGPATFYVGLPFCCAGCVAGGPCICSYDSEPMSEGQIRHCLDVGDVIERHDPATRVPVSASSRSSF